MQDIVAIKHSMQHGKLQCSVSLAASCCIGVRIQQAALRRWHGQEAEALH